MMADDQDKRLADDTALPKAVPDGSGEFSANPKGGGQELLEKSMFPKGGGNDEASVQPKTVTPATGTIIPPANRD